MNSSGNERPTCPSIEVAQCCAQFCTVIVWTLESVEQRGHLHGGHLKQSLQCDAASDDALKQQITTVVPKHTLFKVLYFILAKDMFVCLGLTSLLNTWGHITTVPVCKCGSLTNVLPHRNAMPQTQDMTPHPITVYRHGADLSLCYPSMWNVTLEYTATHFNVLGETRPGNPSPTFHTHQRTLNLMLLWWLTVGSSVERTVPTGSWTRDLWCAYPLRYPLAHSDFLAKVENYTLLILFLVKYFKDT